MKRIALMTTAAVVVAASAAAAYNDGALRRIRLTLTGHKEVPVISTTGHGTFVASINRDETEIRYKLEFSDLEGAVLMSHIHFGPPNNTGGISAWLCGTAAQPGPAGTQPCPSPSGTVEGVITATEVVGPTGQGIEAGAIGELIDAIKAGKTYVNVHSAKWPAGEIRSQIPADGHDSHK